MSSLKAYYSGRLHEALDEISITRNTALVARKKKAKIGRPSLKKAKIGRPTVVTPETIRQLETAFSMGCTDVEACLFANVGSSSLKRHEARFPEFRARKHELKENPILLARQVVIDAIKNEGDVDTARWLLERRKKDEFSSRMETTGKDGQPVIPDMTDMEVARRLAFGLLIADKEQR